MIKGMMYPLPAIVCTKGHYCIYLTEDFGLDSFDAYIYCPDCKEELRRGKEVQEAVLEQSSFIKKTAKTINELTDIALSK